MVLTKKERKKLNKLKQKEESTGRKFVEGIDITKLSPSNQKLLIKAQGQIQRTKSVMPEKTIEGKLKTLIRKEKAQQKKRVALVKRQQFSGGIPGGITRGESQARRIFAPAGPSQSMIPQRPRGFQRATPRPSPAFESSDVINRDIDSSRSAAINDFTNEDVLGRENMFGNEDFRGREDFTSIS